MRRYFLCLSALAALQLTGCASIIHGQNQSLSVATRDDQGELPGVVCKLSNNKGAWFVTTPGSVVVQRSFEDLSLRCEKELFEPGVASAKSSTKGMAFGNILVGGIIGAGVDISTGAAYDYPTLITVAMGKRTSGGEAKAAASSDKPLPVTAAASSPQPATVVASATEAAGAPAAPASEPSK